MKNMYDALQKIIDIIPPPQKPLCVGDTRAWHSIQQRYNYRIPDTMADFFRFYGSGEFEGNSYLTLYNPFDPLYDQWIEFGRQNYAGLQLNTPSFYPYPAFPDKRALFPIGHASGIMSFWLLLPTTPGRYVLVFHEQSTGFTEFQVTSVFDFFYSFFCNQILPNPYFMEPIRFVPCKLTVP